MTKKCFKPIILSFIFTVLCFQFTACGNQNDNYMPDETPGSTMENEDHNLNQDMNHTDDNLEHDTNNTGDNLGQDMENAGDELGQDIENAGDALMNGAEDLLEGDNPANTTEDQSGTNTTDMQNHKE